MLAGQGIRFTEDVLLSSAKAGNEIRSAPTIRPNIGEERTDFSRERAERRYYSRQEFRNGN